MFIEEARLGSLLRHPNVVGVFDFGRDENGQYFLVTELVDGIHLGSWTKTHQDLGEETPWELVAAIAVEVLRALDSAHQFIDSHGTLLPILHRDVTPQNILLDVTGITKLADFGLAKATDREHFTRPNIVKGKLAYLSPEVMSGAKASVQSDLYGLGVVLWETLTGARLYRADSDEEVVRRVREGKVPLLALRRPNVPMSFASIVHRALEKNPNQRFGSAREMLRAITQLLRVVPPNNETNALALSIRRMVAQHQ